eukprot:CAMPEP_0194688330 /NCGR_PEP_ID=MMETSP0295-20121207/16857_1 /TAXON_ID=39354 /ORGANISM="Heterosigma akashiwo, Strain CCMP2393" /LENGTH=40 /DNA_ID= /DNA_START= /DNA_END= /DNA_ORIENTATION=
MSSSRGGNRSEPGTGCGRRHRLAHRRSVGPPNTAAGDGGK